MNYRLVYTHRADRDISRINPMVRERIGRTLLRYSQNPFQYAERLSHPRFGMIRFRIGNCRVVADIEGDQILILRVGHRKDIYRRL